MKIHFATTNKGKIKSLENSFKALGKKVEVLGKHLDIPEIQSDNVVEIAEEKVLYAFNEIKEPVVAQDGGIFIPALNDFPGTYTAYVIKTIGLEGIIRLMQGKDPSAYYRDVMSYMSPGLEKPISFESVIQGSLIDEPRGSLSERNWGTPQLIFVPEGYDKTIAEMSAEEMAEWFETSVGNFCTSQFAKWFIENGHE